MLITKNNSSIKAKIYLDQFLNIKHTQKSIHSSRSKDATSGYTYKDTYDFSIFVDALKSEK